MHEFNAAGVLVVDLQPAYATSNGISRRLMHDTLSYLATLPASTPIAACFVNEELSGDTLESVLEFWQEHDAPPELLERIRWTEKSYAFLRGWMDNGIPEGDIVKVLSTMRELGKWDTRQLAEEELAALSSQGAELADPLLRDESVELLMRALQDAPGQWLTCGGGRDECLAEVELVLRSHAIAFERLEHLTY